jgi:benzoyl-CoA reductase/2-hydroxyglutaryl-CoA dehydratase subunit BcrC/BadD/HgdB
VEPKIRPQSLTVIERLGEKNLLDLEKAKEEGRKVVGLYCTYAPTELILAAGAIPVGLCGKKETPIPEAEKILPSNLCPLIKSSYGYGLTDTCPFFSASDIIVGETTCDGKKKMFELLGRLKPLHLMHLPYSYEQETTLTFWIKEVHRLREFLEKMTGFRIGPESLRYQIKNQNQLRTLLKEIMVQCASDPIPLTGLDMMSIMETRNFIVDFKAYIAILEGLLLEILAIKKAGVPIMDPGATRILLTGCPVGKGSEKVLRLIEDSGGLVVCQENCTGIKSFDRLVNEVDSDPYRAMAHRYLSTPCSCMTPNQGRLELLRRLIKEFRIQGVVDLTWQCCHTYNVETYTIQGLVEDHFSLPFLHLETDYSQSDTELLRVRIEAFLEMAKA